MDATKKAAIFFAAAILFTLCVAELLAGALVPVPAVTSTGEREFYRKSPVLGHVGKPFAVARVEKAVDGKKVFAATYTADSNGWRISPVGAGSGRDKFLLVFGSSHAFGVGVNDNETIPYYLGQAAPRYRPYNLAIASFGLNSFYALTENIRSHVDIKEATGAAVLLFHSLAVNRSVGTFSTIFWGEGEAPYFELKGGERLEFRGMFRDALPWRTRLSKLASKLHLVRYFVRWIDSGVKPADLELACQLVVQGKERLLARLPGTAFRVFLVHDQYPALRECLAGHGVAVTILSEQQIPLIAFDGHFTAEGNRLVAEKMLGALRAGSQ